jgi:antitoxin component YwqK of YwqJK toxin-antitoxin module
MFTSIKSLEIIKQIFSFVYRKHILRFINYNKSLQSKLSINLDTYKNNAKVYRVIENNGQGKEYDIDTDELLFEGEYKNKKRNGIGKEYDEEKLIFEGEYKNGIKNGHGKKYDKNGKLIFEGQYLNGVEWEGKGMIEEEAEEEDVGLLRITLAYYYGEFKEGKINGQGKKINTIYSKDKNDYEGNFLKGKKNGQGKEYYDLNNMKILLYEGEFKDDKRNGYGKEYKNGKIIFEGQFLNGQRWKDMAKNIIIK